MNPSSRLMVLLVVSSGALFAQSGELWFSGGASLIEPKNIGSPVSDGDQSDIQIGNGFRIGFRFGLNSAGHTGHEFQYAYNRTNLTDNTGAILGEVGSSGTAIHQAGYNILYYLHENREGLKVRPFFTAGVHVSDFVLPGSGGPQGSSVKFGGNVGAGLKVRLSPLFNFRMDVREYLTGKPSWSELKVTHQGLGLLSQTELSAGFGVTF
jgi:hypothetical protein